MKGMGASTARLLGSVAQRYRQTLAPRESIPWRGFKLFWTPAEAPEPPAIAGPAARSEEVARLEAVLLLAREPMDSRKLAQLTGLADGTKARTLVRELNRRYDAEGSAFRAEEIAGGFQLLTRPKFAQWLRRLHSSAIEVRLSAPALETLAVVAYRQPVLRVEIEAIRGVQCGEILRQLIERDLVRIAGRSEELGRPFLYGTTKRFLQVFGLRHLDELPRAEYFEDSMPPGNPESGDVMVPVAGADKELLKPSNHFPETEEEQNVTTAVKTPQYPAPLVEPRVAPSHQTLTNRAEDGKVSLACDDEEEEDLDEDEEEEDEDYEEGFQEEEEDEEDWDDEEEDEDFDEEDEEEDEDFEDEPWEEVEDEEELDEDEDEDEDLDEDWEEDEDWEDEDEDWEDEDEGEEEEEEEEDE